VRFVEVVRRHAPVRGVGADVAAMMAGLWCRAGRQGVALLLACAAGQVAAASASQPAASEAGRPQQARVADALEAGQWLQRIQSAAASRSYRGTRVVSNAAGGVSSSRVTHLSDGHQRYERVEGLDGKAQVQLRLNDQLMFLSPATKVVVTEQREAVASFPRLPAAAGQRALEHYELRSLGTDRIAGLEADVLLLKPRDGLRFAQRWWAERDSGLLLRMDLLGPRGDVLESSAFSELTLLPRPKPESVGKALREIEGWRVVRPLLQRVQLDAEGWHQVRPVRGFQLIGAYRGVLDPESPQAAQIPVLQAVYSDGLTHVSVFIEAAAATPTKVVRQPMRTMLGATATVMVPHGEHWITVIGDVPLETALQFDAGLERRP
jgi:sigma-E factor negative regulatory protein RseB